MFLKPSRHPTVQNCIDYDKQRDTMSRSTDKCHAICVTTSDLMLISTYCSDGDETWQLPRARYGWAVVQRASAISPRQSARRSPHFPLAHRPSIPPADRPPLPLAHRPSMPPPVNRTPDAHRPSPVHAPPAHCPPLSLAHRPTMPLLSIERHCPSPIAGPCPSCRSPATAHRPSSAAIHNPSPRPGPGPGRGVVNSGGRWAMGIRRAIYRRGMDERWEMGRGGRWAGGAWAPIVQDRGEGQGRAMGRRRIGADCPGPGRGAVAGD